MKKTTFSRRDWLKKGALSMAGLACIPSETWAHTVQVAQLENRALLYDVNQAFNEFTPPIKKDTTFRAILRANENPYGPPPKAAEAFKNEVFTGNRYSWQTLLDLIDKIALKEGVKPENILMAPGSSDILEKVGMVFYQNGGNVVSADPSYMSLIEVSKAVGGNWKSVKLASDYQHDLKAMEAAIDDQTKLVYICNPNNPTGSITHAKDLKAFCNRVSEKVPVFIDEAYIELSDDGLKNSMVSLVSQGKNVMIARTFSKIHGMAGLRIGYLVANKNTVDALNKITRGGMGITGPSIAAASTSLDYDDFLIMTKTKIAEARAYTLSYLKDHKYEVLPSETNFVIFEIPMEGPEFLKAIYDKQVAVRAFKFWDKNWCRVSIGTMEEMKIFTQAMDEIFI